MTQADLKFFADFIHKELGITYSIENYFQLEKRLNEVMRLLGLKEDPFVAKARSDMDLRMRQLVLDMATNNETSFFRDPKIFIALENSIVPVISENKSDVVRIWCAASSFGQEPYSLAMLLNEMRRKRPAMPRFEIVATDISDNALARTKAAKYTALETARGLPSDYLSRYFTASGDGDHTVVADLRSMVQVKKQNLLETFIPLGSFDLVLCRNVLIYQKDESKREIITRIAQAMNPRGFLVLGAAESLMGLSNDFDQLFKDGTIFFQKKAA